MQVECLNCSSRELREIRANLYECQACGELFEILKENIIETDSEIYKDVKNSKALLSKIRKMLFEYRNYEKAFNLAERNFLENSEGESIIPEFYYALCKKAYEEDNNSLNVYCDFVKNTMLSKIKDIDPELQKHLLEDAINIMNSIRETDVIREIVEASDVQKDLQDMLNKKIKHIELCLEQDGPREIFVCYRSTDIETVQTVVEHLENEGITCWYSERNLPSNYTTNYHAAINKKIAECKIFLFISSEAGKESREIKREMEYAATLDNYRGKNKTRRIELNLGVKKRWSWLDRFFDGLQFIDAENKLQSSLQPLVERISDELYKGFSSEVDQSASPPETDFEDEETSAFKNLESSKSKGVNSSAYDGSNTSDSHCEISHEEYIELLELLEDIEKEYLEEDNSLSIAQNDSQVRSKTTEDNRTKELLITKEGRRYEGETLNSVPHGSGVMLYENGDKYDGSWVNGLRDGFGTYTAKLGDRYCGEWAKGMKHGYGHYHFSDGSYYAGEFSEDQFHGYGVLFYSNDSQYSGNWENGMKHGKGKMEWSNGEIIEGKWVKDTCL